MEGIITAIQKSFIAFLLALGVISPAPTLEKPVLEIPPPTVAVIQQPTATPTVSQEIQDKNSITSKENESHTPKRIEGGPLPFNYKASDANLDAQKIFLLTNIERLKNGKAPLVLNDKLSLMAKVKASDMISRQYFAHLSPDGKNVDDLAENARYDYSLVGENLAMGDFTSEKDVVTGWMNSKGHRENILKTNYTEVGISVILGKGEQRDMWYAVQEFGRPKPTCVNPSKEMSLRISTDETLLKTYEEELRTISTSLSKASSPKEYDSLVVVYNEKTNTHNILLGQTKVLISSYNEAINAYNLCIEKENSILEEK